MSLNCLSGQGVGGESVDVGWICRLDSRVNRQWLACISTEVVSNFFGMQPSISYLHQPLVPSNSQKSQTPQLPYI